MPDEPSLRDKARTAIQGGKLPRQAPDSTFSGPGLGIDCAVCAVAIPKAQMEIEVLFVQHGTASALTTFHVHIRCFAAWEFERTKPGI